MDYINTYTYFIIQGVIEMRDQILTTSYWLHVELGEKYLKNSVKK
jgi:hypothetical protein